MDTRSQGEGRIVALTGYTGFIGGHLAADLAARGWRVRALVRRELPEAGPVELVHGSLGEPAALEALVEGADAVVHLAGAIKGRSRADFMRANADGTGALAAAWHARAPGARFVLVSSMAAREPQLSHYAASKRAAEERLARFDGPWAILRPGAVYGPGDRETLRIFRAAAGPVQPMLNRGAARLTLVHVQDLVRAIAAMLEGGAPGALHEVTDARHEGYGWDELARAAAAALGRRARPVRVPGTAVRLLGRLGDIGGRLGGGAGMLTSQKAREILHPDWGSAAERQVPPDLWRPEIGLEQGFADAVAWYRRAGWLRG